MTTIQSGLTLLNYGTTWSWPGTGGIRLYDQYTHDYATMYRTQPNVRTCVDFIARNIAQLGLHVYRRVSNTDRKPLTAKDHALAAWVARPNAFTTSYRNIFSLVADWGIYNQAFWLKQPEAVPFSSQRIPPYAVQVTGGLNPTGYHVDYVAGGKDYTPEAMVHFRGYNPSDGRVGLSPLETLRRVLAEEHAMGEYREHYWQNAAKMDGVIERPEQKSGKEWQKIARERFIKDLHDLHANVETAGDTLVLEDGMSWKQVSFNAQESEYLAGRKLTREECASAYHIPLPMVGILDHATFSNIKEQHKNLYQDCLGPLLTMITEEIELQLMPEFEDIADVYLEFNILEKMAGSFDEQVTSFQAAVGRPWMTANEARAKLNMPSLGGDADELVTPLNVLTGGQASPLDSAPKGIGYSSRGDAEGAENIGNAGLGSGGPSTKGAVTRLDPTRPQLRARYAEKWTEVMGRYFKRQGAAVRARLPKGRGYFSRRDAEGAEEFKAAVAEVWGDSKRWNAELKKDMFKLNRETAWVWASFVAAQLDAPIAQEPMDAYLDENATWGAEDINDTTKAQVEAALLEDDPASALERVFEVAATARAVQIGVTKVTGMASFGAHEGARQGGLRYKTWQTNSANPRPEHAAMAGTTVKIEELFYQTGQRWPGDPAGGADNNAGCQCSVTFSK